MYYYQIVGNQGERLCVISSNFDKPDVVEAIVKKWWYEFADEDFDDWFEENKSEFVSLPEDGALYREFLEEITI